MLQKSASFKAITGPVVTVVLDGFGITEREVGKRIGYRLEFIEPFASTANSGFTLQEEGGKTHVTWFMEGDTMFMSKVFGIFMDMDAMIGADFEKGLAQLATVAEAEAKKKKAEEAAAAQAAAQPAPAAAPSP